MRIRKTNRRHKKKPVIDRIDEKTDKSGGADACWMWLGTVSSEGTPCMQAGGKNLSVKRAIWEAVHGPIPPKRAATSSCGTRLCVNPAHVELRAWRDPVAQFWEQVQKAEGDACWLWTGPTDTRRGYGQITVRTPQRRVLRASRFSWEIHYGPIPDGLFACHRCDTPACVRPDHLFLGTSLDNTRDMIAKGRAPWQKAKRAS